MQNSGDRHMFLPEFSQAKWQGHRKVTGSRENSRAPLWQYGLFRNIHIASGWWLGHPSEKYESQLG